MLGKDARPNRVAVGPSARLAARRVGCRPGAPVPARGQGVLGAPALPRARAALRARGAGRPGPRRPRQAHAHPRKPGRARVAPGQTACLMRASPSWAGARSPGGQPERSRPRGGAARGRLPAGHPDRGRGRRRARGSAFEDLDDLQLAVERLLADAGGTVQLRFDVSDRSVRLRIGPLRESALAEALQGPDRARPADPAPGAGDGRGLIRPRGRRPGRSWFGWRS